MTGFNPIFMAPLRRLLRAASRLVATPQARTVALVAVVDAFALGLSAMSLQASHAQYQERAATTSRNMNSLVAQTVSGEVERIDMGLHAVIDEYARQRAHGSPDGAAMEAVVARQRSRLPMLDSIRVTDAAGIVVYSDGTPPMHGMSLADRDYFAALRDDARLGLVISKPLVGRANSKPIIVFSRRLEVADGGFEGVVLAPVTLDWFRQIFVDLDVGPNGAVVMRGDASRDFDLLARFPEAGFVGQTKVSDTFRAMFAANPRGGTYQARAGADGVLRTFSYQAVPKFPLITLVGLAEEDVMVGWWREVGKVAVLLVAFLAVTALIGWTLVRTLHSLEHRTDELARSNAELEQFAYVASHDLQTPLRNIASYAQLLARRYGGRLDADADDYIGFIVDGAKRMSTMISDLLDYARIVRHSSRPEVVAVPVAAAVDTVLARLGEAVAAAGATITVGRLPVVRAESVQIESLYQNLIENALRYRDPSRPLEIVVDAGPEQAGWWRFRVQDNGIGIEGEYFDKIFQLFQRLDPLRFPGGTGIGLAICRRVVDRLGGRIWVESEPGKGTAILFTLPVEG
ncbi:MAG: sensor histidine kinase [Actinomycetota bacterium]